MKRLYVLLIGLFVIGCSSNNIMSPEQDCSSCELEIYSDLPQSNGIYELEYNQDLAQTYSTLSCFTGCGWGERIQWDSDYKYRASSNDGWISLVNPANAANAVNLANLVNLANPAKLAHPAHPANPANLVNLANQVNLANLANVANHANIVDLVNRAI